MKKTRTALSILLASVITFVCLYAVLINAQTVKAQDVTVDDTNDDWLYADGSKLYDMYGNEVWLTGANWFGFNCSECVLHGLWSAELRDTLKSIADHGINLLRVPVSTELLYYWMQGTPAPATGLQAANGEYYKKNAELVKPDGTVMNSMEVFDTMMSMCKEYGIKVMVDVHSPDANNSGHNYSLWYGKEMSTGVMVTTDIWMDTWVWLVDKYKNDDTLIAVDLKNEPHGKANEGTYAKWDNSNDENNWKYASETCAKKILAVNPNILIVIEGNETFTKNGTSYGAWWGGNLRGVADYPVDLGNYQSQVVYSPHDYGPAVFAQTWFNKDFTRQTLLDDYWYDTWAYIADQNIAPLLIGEWGGYLDGGKNEKWLNIIQDYIIENKINHTFWCINPNSGDTGGLLENDYVSWEPGKYGLLEEALWQTSDGKYIGLDHKKALGENGLSLTEYYDIKDDDPINKKPESGSGTVSDNSNNSTNSQNSNNSLNSNNSSNSNVSNNSYNSYNSNNSDSDLPKPQQKGDVNLDGVIDIMDVVAIRSHIVGNSMLKITEQEIADMNSDNVVDISDVVSLRNCIVNA